MDTIHKFMGSGLNFFTFFMGSFYGVMLELFYFFIFLFQNLVSFVILIGIIPIRGCKKSKKVQA